MLIAVLVFVKAGCFFREMSYVKSPASGVIKGMFVPMLADQGAIALLGALFIHNLFLHSTLVLPDKYPTPFMGSTYFLIESSFALLVAFSINVAVVSISGAVYFTDNLSSEDHHHCNDLNLNYASFLLQMILSFELSFALIPLCKFSSSSTKLEPYTNSKILLDALIQADQFIFFLHKQFVSIVACLHSAILACNSTGSHFAYCLQEACNYTTRIELPHVAELTPLTDSHLCILSSTGVFIRLALC
ncbi:hypothetical protein GOBAR_AA23416 [Gossypium barbadense]|uniref:Uncharacterized protein n=1 Tax=Gossypium barbadense TaxID=3634 RepID=A0A2P5X1Q2_GOSBA|nr:hypothetical protein GOBAR_AA23416 [Gossypium barbadense]